MNKKYLVCKRVTYYSPLDEAIFFSWIKKIKCIEKFEGARDELYLDLVDKELGYEDMKNLIALFYRYKIDMTQLAEFVNTDNKDAFDPWRRKIFKSKKADANQI